MNRLRVLAAVMPAVPVGVVAWQAGWLLAATRAPSLHAASLAVGGATVASFGASTGARAQHDDVSLEGAVRAAASMLTVAAAAVAVAVLSASHRSTALADLISQPLRTAGATLVAALVVLTVAHRVGKAVGRSLARQGPRHADERLARQGATDLLIMVLVGTAAAALFNFVGWRLAPATTPSMAAAVPTVCFISGILAIAVSRPLLLAELRPSIADAPAILSWLRAHSRFVLLTAALTLIAAGSLHLGLREQLHTLVATPGTPTQTIDPGPAPAPTGPATTPRAPAFVDPPPEAGAADDLAAGILLATALAAVLSAAALLVHALPRLVRAVRTLLQHGATGVSREPRAHRRRHPEQPQESKSWPARIKHLSFIQLRLRPNDPTAAILHDYRTVQRALPAEQRRRPAETAKAHAHRLGSEPLGRLAHLVATCRYTTHQSTHQDAAESLALTRKLAKG